MDYISQSMVSAGEARYLTAQAILDASFHSFHNSLSLADAVSQSGKAGHLSAAYAESITLYFDAQHGAE